MVTSCERRTVLQAGQTTITYHHSGDTILIGGLAGNMMILNGADDDDPIDLEAHEMDIRDIACHGDTFVTCGDDNRAELRTLPEGEFESILFRTTSTVLAANFSKNGKLIAVGACEGDAKLVETEDAKKVITLECDQTAVRDIVFDPMGEYVATASASGMARVFEINGTRVYEESLIEKTDVATATSTPYRISWSHDGQLLALPHGNTFTILTRATWEQVPVPEGLSKSNIDIVAFAPSEQLLATANSTGAVVVYSSVATEQSPVYKFQNPGDAGITGLAWHPSGTGLLWSDNEGAWGVFGDIDPKKGAAKQTAFATSAHTAFNSGSIFESEAGEDDDEDLDAMALDTDDENGEDLINDMINDDNGDDADDFHAALDHTNATKSMENDNTNVGLPASQPREDDEPGTPRKRVLKRKNKLPDMPATDTDPTGAPANAAGAPGDGVLHELDDDAMFEVDGLDDIPDVVEERHHKRDDVPPVTMHVAETVEETVKKLQGLQQEPFQPSSQVEPDASKRRFLCWNMDASIVSRVEEDYASVDIEFADSTEHSNIKIVDQYGFTMGAVNMTAAVLASPMRKKSASTIQCKIFNAWAGNADWTHQLPANEEVLVVAVGTRWVAAATSMNYLRIFSASGCQISIQSLPGRCVSMASEDNKLAVVYHKGFALDDQQMDFVLFDINDDSFVPRCVPLCLTPASELEWMGFTPEGLPITYDSTGVVRALTDKPFAPWMPVLDTRERFNSDNQMWAWIIGATSQEIIFVVCRNGNRSPSATHKPIVTETPLQMPLCGVDLTSGKLEEELVRTSNMIQPTATDKNQKAAIAARLDSNRLRLMQVALQHDKPLRIMDLACMLTLPKSYDIAIQLMSRARKPDLAKRISILMKAKVQEIEEEQEIARKKEEGTTVIYMNAPTTAEATANAIDLTADHKLPKPTFTRPARDASATSTSTLPHSSVYGKPIEKKRKGKSASAAAGRSLPKYNRKERVMPRCETFTDEEFSDSEMQTNANNNLDTNEQEQLRETSIAEQQDQNIEPSLDLDLESEGSDTEQTERESKKRSREIFSDSEEEEEPTPAQAEDSPVISADIRPAVKINPFASNKSHTPTQLKKSTTFFDNLSKLADRGTPKAKKLKSVGSVLGKGNDSFKEKTAKGKPAKAKKQASLGFKSNPFAKAKNPEVEDTQADDNEKTDDIVVVEKETFATDKSTEKRPVEKRKAASKPSLASFQFSKPAEPTKAPKDKQQDKEKDTFAHTDVVLREEETADIQTSDKENTESHATATPGKQANGESMMDANKPHEKEKGDRTLQSKKTVELVEEEETQPIDSSGFVAQDLNSTSQPGVAA